MADVFTLCVVLLVGVLRGIAGEAWVNIDGNVCFESKDGKPGIFKLPEAGFLQGVRFTHVSGSVTCAKQHKGLESKWGCYAKYKNLKGMVSVIVTDTSNNVILPIEARNQPKRGRQTHFYSGGNAANSAQITFYDDVTTTWFDDGAELKVWYGEDYYDTSEHDNDGRSCGTVSVLYGK